MGVLSVSTLLTPFQFSSSKMQADTMLANNLPNSTATDLLLATLAWYEMWVNPEKIVMNDKYINTGELNTILKEEIVALLEKDQDNAETD